MGMTVFALVVLAWVEETLFGFSLLGKKPEYWDLSMYLLLKWLRRFQVLFLTVAPT
jgi:hypothetical protein